MSQGQSDSTATTAVISSTEASVAVDPMENFIPPLPESFMDKGLRKCRENPFVPVGALVTCAFLASGFSAFQKGQKKKMQLMMRGRVFAQGFTLVVICGSYFMSLKHKAAASKTPEEIAAAAVLQQVPPSVRTVAAAASAPSVITTPVAAAMDAAKKA